MLRCLSFALLLAGASLALSEPLPIVKAERVGLSAPKLALIRDYFEQQVELGLEPGFQLLVARHGHVVMHENIGYSNIETREPITFATLFRMMSLTKPVTNAAAMILFEQGRFRMNDPIAKFLPELAGLRVYAGSDESGAMLLEDPVHPPTMHELMTHTAGFTYGGRYARLPVDAIYESLEPFEPGIRSEEVLARLSRIPLAYQPGTEYAYSYSADILGIVIERISGTDLGSFMQAQIFNPLGMDMTRAWVPPELEAQLIKIHQYDASGALILAERSAESVRDFDHALVEPAMFAGGYQLISTTQDYFLFAQMLLNGGEMHGKRILSASTVKFMTTQRYPEAVRDRYWAPGQGHGLNVSVVVDPTLINYPVSEGEFSHGGFANGYFFVDPKQNIVFIMQGQLMPPRFRSAHIPIVNALLHAAIIE